MLSDTVILTPLPDPTRYDNPKTGGLRDLNRANAIFLRAQAADALKDSSSAQKLYSLFASLWSGAETAESDVPADVSPFVVARQQAVQAWLAANSPSGGDSDSNRSKLVVAAAFAIALGVAFVGLLCWHCYSKRVLSGSVQQYERIDRRGY
mgnify:CR=1 FL=1